MASFPVVGWLIATVVSIVSGAIWFGPKTFYPAWWKAMGKSFDEQPGSKDQMGLVFGLTFLGAAVQNAVLAFALVQMKVVGAAAGLQAGLILGIGLAAFTSLSHRLFAGQGLRVWMIEVGNDVLNLAVAGAVIGAFLS